MNNTLPRTDYGISITPGQREMDIICCACNKVIAVNVIPEFVGFAIGQHESIPLLEHMDR